MTSTPNPCESSLSQHVGKIDIHYIIIVSHVIFQLSYIPIAFQNKKHLMQLVNETAGAWKSKDVRLNGMKITEYQKKPKSSTHRIRVNFSIINPHLGKNSSFKINSPAIIKKNDEKS